MGSGGSQKIFVTVKAFSKRGQLLQRADFQTLAESRDLDELVTRIKNTKYLDAVNGVSKPYTAEKLICEIRNIRSQMDKKKLFSRQTRLINDVNKKLSDKVFSNFVPNYRSLATIYQIFDSELPVKKRVILEQNILAGMVSLKGEKEGTMKPIDNVVFKTFSKKFNEQYSGSLLEEQKELLKHYIFSFSDNGLSLKVYLNEELGRLKTRLVSSLREEDVENDEEMTSKTRNIISMLEEYTQNKLDEKVIKKIMKIQGLVQELDS